MLAWLPQARSDQLRRLQMAAAEYRKLLFVMRPAAAQDEASPAVLRLHIQPHAAHATQPVRPAPPLPDALQVHLLKRRGPPLEPLLHLQARPARLTLLLAASQAHALDCTPSRS